jgi:hypothetical protein
LLDSDKLVLGNKFINLNYDKNTQKNWIMIKYISQDKTYWIEKFNPFIIREVSMNTGYSKEIFREENTYFKDLRGSTNFIKLNDSYYGFTHIKSYAPYYIKTIPVILNKSFRIKFCGKYPIKFTNNHVDYPMSILKKDNMVYISVGKDDLCTNIYQLTQEKFIQLFLNPINTKETKD